MRGVFISYRRDDSEGQSGRLFEDLVQHFGRDAVFMDVTGLKKGLDFRRAIEQNVSACGVLLVIIGKNWLSANNEDGKRRLDDANDFVRLETAAALKRDIPVVPVLVQGARMPREDELPADLAALAFRNGAELTHARWESDVKLLIEDLKPYVEQPDAAIATLSTAAPAQTVAAPPPPTVNVAEIKHEPRRIALWALVLALIVGFGAWGAYQVKRSADEAQRVATQKALELQAAKDAAQHLADEKAALERERDKAVQDKAATEKAAADKLAADRAAGERRAREAAAARERAERERVAREQAEADRIARERAEAERIARDKAAADRLAAEKAAAKAAADRRAREVEAAAAAAAATAGPSLGTRPGSSVVAGTCLQGYVWREAGPADRVCVTPTSRSQAAADNQQAAARRQPGGGGYGANTCREGFVWREAFKGDLVCVSPESRARAADENARAQTRVARP